MDKSVHTILDRITLYTSGVSLLVLRGRGNTALCLLIFTSHSHIQGDRAVVAPQSCRANFTITQALQKPLGYQKVVEPPAHVFGPGVHHVCPEGIGVGHVGVKVTEGVDKASLQQLPEARTFLWGKACILLIALGVLEVNLLVRYVEVPTQDEGLAGSQAFEVRTEGHIPALAVFQTHQPPSGIGDIGCDQEIGGELG